MPPRRHLFSPTTPSGVVFLYNQIQMWRIVSLFICFLIFLPSPVLAADKKVALTFDADMTTGMLKKLNNKTVSTYYPKAMANYIVANQIPVTIFTTGLFAEKYSSELKNLSQYSFIEFENHSYDHASLVSPCFGLPKSKDNLSEITNAQSAIKNITGQTPKYFRFPGGCSDQNSISLVRSQNLDIGSWTVVSGDAFQSNSQIILNNIKNKVRHNEIIVLHFGTVNAPATSKALPKIVDYLKKQGYQLVTLKQFYQN